MTQAHFPTTLVDVDTAKPQNILTSWNLPQGVSYMNHVQPLNMNQTALTPCQIPQVAAQMYGGATTMEQFGIGVPAGLSLSAGQVAQTQQYDGLFKSDNIVAQKVTALQTVQRHAGPAWIGAAPPSKPEHHKLTIKLRREFKRFAKQVDKMSPEVLLRYQNIDLSYEDKPTFYFENSQSATYNCVQLRANDVPLVQNSGTLYQQNLQQIMQSDALIENLSKLPGGNQSKNKNKKSAKAFFSQYKKDKNLPGQSFGNSTASTKKPQDTALPNESASEFLNKKSMVERKTYAGLKTMPLGSYRKVKMFNEDLKQVITHFVCQFNNCNQMFTKSTSLIVHNWRHNNVRPFQCTLCNRSFTQSGTLSRHNNAVHGIQSTVSLTQDEVEMFRTQREDKKARVA